MIPRNDISSPPRKPLLAIDGSTEFLGIAMENALGRRTALSLDSGMKHGERIMACIQSLLESMDVKPADLGGIVCSKGPGSFTGLRIGMAVAKGLACGLDLPIFTVSILDAMAWQYRNWPGLSLCLVDARKNRWYGGWYKDGERIRDHADQEFPGYLQELENMDRAANPGNLPLMLVSPHGVLLESAVETAKKAGVTLFTQPSEASCFWMEGLLALGRKEEAGGKTAGDDQGPEYLRYSHEDLGIHVIPK